MSAGSVSSSIRARSRGASVCNTVGADARRLGKIVAALRQGLALFIDGEDRLGTLLGLDDVAVGDEQLVLAVDDEAGALRNLVPPLGTSTMADDVNGL